MKAGLVVIASLVARTAFAQAPGEVQPVQPVPIEAPRCGDCIPVMQDRWSLGVGLAATGLQATRAGDMDQANFGGFDLAVRFRATLHLELQVMLGESHENHEDLDSHMQLGTFRIGLRYRFLPMQRWNIYVAAAVGGATLTQDAQPKSDSRPMFELGVGGEYRFDHLALQLELRGLGIAGLLAVPIDDPINNDGLRLAGGLSGGQALLDLSYYF